jgi:hypothetical protein
MTKNFTYVQKSTGDTLSAAEWNNLAQDVDAAVDAINNGGVSGGSIEGVSISDKGNLELSSAKHINLEPAYVSGGGEGTYGDIQMKPGDDITLESSHRALDKQNEITIKTSNGKSKNDPDKGTVKLQVKAADITLSSEGKPGSDPNVMNVNVTTGSGKGYLKVRAQAIDLRCEDHGGIALQPKGTDGQGNMNKIKFEHGGGDGLEFGTFNTEHTSLFTGDYRFNKAGVIRLATRTTEVSDKADANDATTAYKYVKAADDFYDNIDANDPTCTWEDIVKYIAWAKTNNQGPWAI